MDRKDRLVRTAPPVGRHDAQKAGKLGTALSLCKSGRFDLLLYKLGDILGFQLVLPHLPSRLLIEPTNACNLHCPLCLTGSGRLNRPTRMMSLAEFQGIIDQVRGYVSKILLWNNGEPFLNNELVGMIEDARSAGMYVATSTNGQFFRSREFCSEVVQSGLQRLIISFDGADQGTLDKYRSGAKFDRIVNGVRFMHEAKESLASETPTIELQFLVMRHNEHQMDDMRKLAVELGADIFRAKAVAIIGYRDSEFQSLAKEYVPQELSLGRYELRDDGAFALKGKVLNRCAHVYESAVINADGTVVPCCYDIYSGFVMGNVFEESLRTIWKNSSYQSLRRRIRKDRHSIPMCNTCSDGRAEFRNPKVVEIHGVRKVPADRMSL